MEQRLLQYQEEIRLANEALVSTIMSIFSSAIYIYIYKHIWYLYFFRGVLRKLLIF